MTENNLTELRDLLLLNPAIVCCSAKGEENRLPFFKRYIEPEFKHLFEYLVKNMCNIILFVSKVEKPFFEKKDGSLYFAEQDFNLKELDSIYIPVRNNFLQKSFVYVIVPSIESILMINLHNSIQKKHPEIYKVVLFDSFPYEEGSEVELVKDLYESYVIKGGKNLCCVEVALFDDRRQHGYTDISCLKEAVSKAKDNYSNYCDNCYSFKFDDMYLIEDFYLRKNLYVDNLVKKYIALLDSIVSRQVEIYRSQTNKIFEGRIFEINQINKIFSHESWKLAPDKSVILFWFKELRKHYCEAINREYNEIEYILNKVSKNNSVEDKEKLFKEFEKRMLSHWETLFPKLLVQKVELSKNINKIDYMNKTDKYRELFVHEMDKLKSEFKSKVADYLQEKIDFWLKLLT
jgi:hypothetical protein